MTARAIVLPAGGYAEHVAHGGEPIVDWLAGLDIPARVFRHPLGVRHPQPLDARRAEIGRLRHLGFERIGVMGFSAGGHLAGLAAVSGAADFAVLAAITSMETETYRPARRPCLRPRAAQPRPGAGQRRRRSVEHACGVLDRRTAPRPSQGRG